MSCSHEKGDCSQLVVLVADGTGKTSKARLACPRWFQLLGCTAGGATVNLVYGDKTAQVEIVNAGNASRAYVGAGGDVFLQLSGMTPGETAFLGVSR